MNKKILENVIKKCINYSEVSNELYGNNYYGNRETIKRYIDIYDLDISHFTFISRNLSNNNNKFKKIPIIQILVKNSTYSCTTSLKERLYREGLKKRECELCGQDEEWKGKKMSLILDHKNGINNDNRKENLRIVCPNCNATLPTHGGKNNKHIIFKKKITKVKKIENRVNTSISQRTVERPEYEILLQNIKIKGYTGTGKLYGVSDNAIRKWVKFYEKFK